MDQKRAGKGRTDVQKMTADILVAEDDDEIRQLVEEKLNSKLSGEYEVVTAKDGDETWKHLEESAEDPPELVVLDVMMPNLDGFSVLERIRDDDNFDEVQVIILTSRSREEDISRALESGADDFVAKPFSPTDLASNVKERLS